MNLATDAESPRGFGVRFLARVTDRSQLAFVIVAPALWLGSRAGLIADVPIWLVLAILVVAELVTAVAWALWPDAQSGWRLFARVGFEIMMIAMVIYAIGWGPTLAIGLLFGAADNLRVSGSNAVAPVIFWSAIGIGLGELAITISLAPSLVHEPLVHGVAALAALGMTFTMQLLGRATANKEQAEQEVRQSAERFKTLVQHASDIIIVIGPEGELAYVSPAFERVLGYSPADALGQPALQFAHPDDVEGARRALRDVHGIGEETARTEVRLRHRDGAWKWFDASVTNVVDDPTIGAVANLRDVTERMHAQSELREAEERFRSAFENAPIGMALADPQGRLFRVNPAFSRLLGYQPQELLGASIADFTHPDDWENNAQEIRRLFAGETPGYRLEKRYIHADGHTFWVSVEVSVVRSDDGDPLYMIGQIEDITERKAIAERLEHAAIHDPLTGLANRVLFMDRLALALNRTRRQHSQVGVIFLDLDCFKVINDSLGHATGDKLLITLGERLRHAVRAGDTVARFGGDEFVVLCDQVADEAMVLDVAKRVAETIAGPAMLEQREVFTTASLGVVISGPYRNSAEDLLRDADIAMYRAKDQGRARIELFDERIYERTVERLQMSAALHRALERSELEVHYQPIVELETGRVSGFEALLRWRHATRGLVDPAAFIDIAEETGLIVPIGAWVLEEACRQVACWQSRRQTGVPLSISVNLAPRQLAEPSFPQELSQVLRCTGIDPAAVWLELTESALMHDASSSICVLEALRSQGVHLAIDDFGTGYSSLGYLKRFPVEALKVDHTFVDGLGHETEDTTIVGAVVSLAHSLGLAAVAEGLETPLQLSELRAMGCDFAQGFLFGAPRPAQEIGEHPADDLSSWHGAGPH